MFIQVTVAIAQDTATILLPVMTAQNFPLADATVALRKLPDSGPVKMQLPDMNGKAIFERMPSGTYSFQVSDAGFTRLATAAFSVAGDHYQHPLVSMQASGSEVDSILSNWPHCSTVPMLHRQHRWR